MPGGLPLTKPRTLLKVIVQTRAACNEILGFRGDVLQVKVTAPPESGKANAAVLELVAKAVKVPKTSIRLVRGLTSREKVMAFDDLSTDDFRSRLGGAVRRDEL